MNYSYSCDVKPGDLWKMAMRRTYRSALGVVNVIFTIAMLLLLVRFWSTAPDILKGLMLMGVALFPIIQPLATYGMCVRQLENMPRDMNLSFDDAGVHITTGGKNQDLNWSRITNAIRQKNMIVVMSDDRHGYMITDRALGNEKEEFYNFLCGKIKSRPQ